MFSKVNEHSCDWAHIYYVEKVISVDPFEIDYRGCIYMLLGVFIIGLDYQHQNHLFYGPIFPFTRMFL